jgi:hypothetical protein
MMVTTSVKDAIVDVQQDTIVDVCKFTDLQFTITNYQAHVEKLETLLIVLCFLTGCIHCVIFIKFNNTFQ